MASTACSIAVCSSVQSANVLANASLLRIRPNPTPICEASSSSTAVDRRSNASCSAAYTASTPSMVPLTKTGRQISEPNPWETASSAQGAKAVWPVNSFVTVVLPARRATPNGPSASGPSPHETSIDSR